MTLDPTSCNVQKIRLKGVKQTTFLEGAFERFHKPMRRAVFLAEMERVVAWAERMALIEPFYPKAGKRSVNNVQRVISITFSECP